MIKKVLRKIKKTFVTKEVIPIVTPVTEGDLLTEKVALITGGSGGIGLAIAKELLRSGCKVIITGTNESKLLSIQKEIANEKFQTLTLNYENVDSFDNKLQQAISEFGKIDIFISSTGVHTENVSFFTLTPEEYDRVMDINLKGTFFMCQKISKYMIDQKIKGKILLISSSRGSEPAYTPYGLSKWGMKGFVLGLAQNLMPYGICVNAIAPGSTATELLKVKEVDSILSEENGMHRLVMPAEVASVAKLLISEAGDMISGETIHISAGRGTFDVR